MSTPFVVFERPGEPMRAPFLLLHGTGGDEHDLVELADMIDPRRALVSLRGKVREGGAHRFFRRFAEGLFDEADVRLRAREIADFLADQRNRKGWAHAPLALGFSNGANIAAALLYLHPEALSSAILLRAMVPLQDETPAPQADRPVLMISGAMDPIVPASNAGRLASILAKAGAHVQHETLPTGHGLTGEDVHLARGWISSLPPGL